MIFLIAAMCVCDVNTSHPGGSLDSWLSSRVEPVRVHSVRWHIVGSAETKSELLEHLLTHPNHADVRAKYSRERLSRMSRSELMTLHDDSHEGRIRVKRSSSCPGGVCPASSRPRREHHHNGVGLINIFH